MLTNVIIPSIKIDQRLINCLDGLAKQTYKKFFVTLVLDQEANLLLKKYKFKINTIIVDRGTNMSIKRNLGAKKHQSELIAFIDSDAKPFDNWLENAVKIISEKGYQVIGGPNIPFQNQLFLEKLTYYCKRSFFVTAHYNFIKFLSFDTVCDWLDSSNLIINRNLFLKINGMDESLYIGEDHDLCFRLKKQFPKLEIFFSKNVAVFHEDRAIHHYFLQRFCYGLNVFTSKNTLIKRFLATLPAVAIILTLLLLATKLITFKLIIISLILLFFISFYELIRYVDKAYEIIPGFISIILCNFFYGIGTISYFLGIRKHVEKKIYRNIKKDIKIETF